MDSALPLSLREPTWRKAVRLIRTRPGSLFAAARGYSLFVIAYALRRAGLCSLHGVSLGENVRLQRNASLMAEAPDAKIDIAQNCIIYEHAHLEAYGSGLITVGKQSIIGDAKIISRASIHIGERFLCSWNVFIQDFNPHPLSQSQRATQVEVMVATFRPQFKNSLSAPSSSVQNEFSAEGISIGNDVWAGAQSIILKGANIGDGCIIAAGAVVTAGCYAPRSVLAGNPAKIVKEVER